MSMSCLWPVALCWKWLTDRKCVPDVSYRSMASMNETMGALSNAVSQCCCGRKWPVYFIYLMRFLWSLKGTLVRSGEEKCAQPRSSDLHWFHIQVHEPSNRVGNHVSLSRTRGCFVTPAAVPHDTSSLRLFIRSATRLGPPAPGEMFESMLWHLWPCSIVASTGGG